MRLAVKRAASPRRRIGKIVAARRDGNDDGVAAAAALECMKEPPCRRSGTVRLSKLARNRNGKSAKHASRFHPRRPEAAHRLLRKRRSISPRQRPMAAAAARGRPVSRRAQPPWAASPRRSGAPSPRCAGSPPPARRRAASGCWPRCRAARAPRSGRPAPAGRPRSAAPAVPVALEAIGHHGQVLALQPLAHRGQLFGRHVHRLRLVHRQRGLAHHRREHRGLQHHREREVAREAHADRADPGPAALRVREPRQRAQPLRDRARLVGREGAELGAHAGALEHRDAFLRTGHGAVAAEERRHVDGEARVAHPACEARHVRADAGISVITITAGPRPMT
ncbi:hypothetical protein DdX_20788 [Ditylenchus destructor]|uniref:Uncharacterized protein n=1 Tax=Ditylenchus destructor TaxID=166010 RepID=A0AAD4MI97_9BILA|nr:hypothetical protein DdX_20788 [Ditylenchus destructor]